MPTAHSLAGRPTAAHLPVSRKAEIGIARKSYVARHNLAMTYTTALVLGCDSQPTRATSSGDLRRRPAARFRPRISPVSVSRASRVIAWWVRSSATNLACVHEKRPRGAFDSVIQPATSTTRSQG